MSVKERVGEASILTSANLTGARLELRNRSGVVVFVFDSSHGATPVVGQGRILIDNVAKSIELYADYSVTAGIEMRVRGELLIDSDLNGGGRWPFARVVMRKQ
jgi:hypothetical protein